MLKFEYFSDHITISPQIVIRFISQVSSNLLENIHMLKSAKNKEFSALNQNFLTLNAQ